jgi:hypothetical protein
MMERCEIMRRLPRLHISKSDGERMDFAGALPSRRCTVTG